ncbi:LysR family transcriptional regulator [Phytoactinopolyspora endophytica]|uniref:LysR family transcriptional regulator n=1 Tax=Phytoactinopolyspora endophytica TaxID=1642495 RepID=UPI00101E10A6
MESRALRYFVAVAEELNFTRAADRLGISAPPLSRAIRALEADLGVPLLERDTHSVTLTTAGTVLLGQARPGLDTLEAAGRRAQRAGATTPQVVLAVKADNDAGLLDTILTRYAAEDAALPVTVRLCGWGEEPRLLRRGEADVALIHGPFDGTGLDAEPVTMEPTVAAVPLGHAFARLGTATLANLELPVTGPTDTASMHGYQRRLVDEHGIRDLPQLFALVELGRITALVPRSVMDRYPRPRLAYIDVADAPPSVLSIVWPQESRFTAVAALVRAATELEPSAPATSLEI